MTCRSCGAQIADKAIVCYRCGTPTEEVVARLGPPRRRRKTLWVLVSILAALLAWAAYFLLLRSP